MMPTTPRPAAVTATGLTKRFRTVTAVADVTIEVPTGSVFGLLGPDGAGKSTLLKLLATVMTPTAGDAAVAGHPLSRPALIRPRLGYMPQRFCMYPDLTVAENVEFFATVRGVDRTARRDRAAALLASLGLAEFTKRRAGRLSGGMKQKLMLAATLMTEPELLLLDEPTTGVDPLSRREFWRIIADLHAQGRTLVVATPYMDEAERCTDIAFMDTGRITRTGTPAEITALVPGVLFEVQVPDPRTLLARTAAHPDVVASHLLGEAARIVWTGDPGAFAAAFGLTPDAACRIPVDMETAFAVIATTGREAVA